MKPSPENERLRSPNRVNRQKRAGDRGRQRRRARRALAKAMQTSAEIQGSAKHRQRSRSRGEANTAASFDTDLLGLYREFGEDKRAVFATGLVPNGAPYKGRTWRAS